MAKREKMGLDFGLESMETCFKVKHRWLFSIPDVVAGGLGSADALPPSKGARPNLSFKEQEVQHETETVYFPVKPEWKPITLTLYDIRNNKNPVFDWIKHSLYWPKRGEFYPSLEHGCKRTGTLELYSGCGDVIESWTFDNCWPQAANWGELDMASSEIVTVDVTIRYDRAYITENGGSNFIAASQNFIQQQTGQAGGLA